MTETAAAAIRPTAHSLEQAFGAVTERIADIPLRRGFGRGWLILFSIASAFFLVGAISVVLLLAKGPGIWGINQPVGWGFDIINFVWWIGIGHAGTLISAVLLLFRQHWRNSINRFAEAMTLFAVLNAALFPLLHLGRPWVFYYIAPYPNTMDLWPQWRSPLVWDFFAVMTYSMVSLLFWYVGLIPDLATLRDRSSRRWIRVLTGALSLGWRGSLRHWQHHQQLYLLLAGLATPLVVSVHSIVSFDFAVGIVPGWHSTIFPPYFVAGAIYSGFAMVFTIALPLRAVYGFRDVISSKHLDNMAKVMLVSGLIVGYGYLMEHFVAWYSGEAVERFAALNRATGPYAGLFWLMLFCNVGVVQALWLRHVRSSPPLLFAISLFVNLGMWLERFVIISVSLHRDYLPSSWGMYIPTIWDWSLFAGTLGFFTMLMLLFVRLIPMISVFEMRELVNVKHDHQGDAASHFAAPRRDVDEVAGLGESLVASRQADLPYEGVDPAEVRLHGIAAEFRGPNDLQAATRRAREAGYRQIDAYAPLPLPEMYPALNLNRSPLPKWVLAGGVLGAVGGYLMQWYTATTVYPFDIGGRPAHSWPSFIPLTFELGILGAATCGLLAMLTLNGLPRPYHPMLNLPAFRRASQDRFFLCIERTDPRFSREHAWQLLASTGALRVAEVPA